MKTFTKADFFITTREKRIDQLNGLQLASFKSRFFAFLTDMFIIYLINLLVFLPNELSKYSSDITNGLNVHFNPFHDFWTLIILIAYFTLLTYFLNGKTIGKKIFKIRIISLIHDKLSLWHSFERSLGYVASSLEAGFGFVQYFIHPNHQTVHDRIAETIVIKELLPDYN
jgi:uncharacterized RDD family membrane protein YckC